MTNTEEKKSEGANTDVENSSQKDRVEFETGIDNQSESPPLLGFSSAGEPVNAVLVVSDKPGDSGTPTSQGIFY